MQLLDDQICLQLLCNSLAKKRAPANLIFLPGFFLFANRQQSAEPGNQQLHPAYSIYVQAPNLPDLVQMQLPEADQ